MISRGTATIRATYLILSGAIRGVGSTARMAHQNKNPAPRYRACSRRCRESLWIAALKNELERIVTCTPMKMTAAINGLVRAERTAEFASLTKPPWTEVGTAAI